MATEQAFPSTAVAIGGGRVITTPFQFVADADTFLRVTSVCSVTGVTLAVQGRRRDDNGTLQPIKETHAPNSNRTTKTQDYGLGPGAILNLTMFATAGALVSGQCYVKVELLRNFGGTAIVLGTLLGGYVTPVQALGFPGSPIVSSLEGEPALRAIAGTLQPVGQIIAETVPTGARWELISLVHSYTTDATVITRRVLTQLTAAGVPCFVGIAFNAQGASDSWTHTWGPNIEGTSDATIKRVQSGIPGRTLMPSASTFFVTAANLQAGDQFGQPFYLVREWLEVN
jgi:hypothetical protein